MFSAKTWGLTMPLAALAASVASVAPASAATVPTQQLGCESAVARVTSLVSPLLAPVTQTVANPGVDPCTTTAPVSSPGGTVLDLGSLGTVSSLLGGAPQLTGAASAVTTSSVSAGVMSALATATENGVTVPTPAGNVTIPAATSSVSYACQNGSVVPQVTGALPSITVPGYGTITSPTAGEVIPLDLLGTQIGTVTVDPNVTTTTSDTTDLAEIHITGVADIDVGQAAVTQPASDMCSQLVSPGGRPGTPGTGTPGSPGTPGVPGSPGVSGVPGATGTSSTACPAGTVLSAGACVVPVFGGTPIRVMSAESSEIHGASVISLAAARRRYHSPCLRGPGPNFVIVGTNGRNRITVSKIRSRVLGLGGNDTITIKGGNGTCVDAGAGSDHVTNRAANRIRVYGGTGNDHVRIGNGPAAVSLGAGNDTVNAGRGRVSIAAGSGRNVITARGAHDHVSASGRGTIAHLPRAAMPYARAHGVRRVFAL